MVTILMNMFNEERHFLVDAINSCLKQKGVTVQLIISTVEGDRNIDFVRREYPKVEIVITPKAEHPGKSVSGSYVQINNALHLVKGDWFFFISSNDVLRPNKCQLEIQTCKKKKKEICYSNFCHVSEAGKFIKITKLPEYSRALHLTGNFVSDASLISKRILDKYKPFNIELNNFAFWDFWLRVYEGEGNVFCFNPCPAFNYRIMRSSMHIARQRDRDQVLSTTADRRRMLSLHR